MENQNFYDHLLAEESRVKDLLSHIQGLIKHYGGTPTIAAPIRQSPQLGEVLKSAISNTIHEGMFVPFNKRAVIPEKVLYALRAIGSGTSREVGEKLNELDETYTEEKAIDDARFHLSQMAKAGKINAENIPGMRGFIYSCKNEEATEM